MSDDQKGSDDRARPTIVEKTSTPKSPGYGQFSANPKPDGSSSPKAPDTTSEVAPPPPARDD